MKNYSIPLLNAHSINCRVQSVSKDRNGRVGAVLLLYKDARADMDILDHTFGAGNWQRTHEVINGDLFCNLDIWDDEKGMWVRKQDVGTENHTEKEKSRASDSFKRACVNIGIGRELYTAPFIYVELAEDEYYTDTKGTKPVLKCSAKTKFKVEQITYNERREIKDITIVDQTGKTRFIKTSREPTPRSPKADTAKRAAEDTATETGAGSKPEPLATPNQVQEIRSRCTKEQADKLCEQYGVSSIEELTRKEAMKTITLLKRREGNGK